MSEVNQNKKVEGLHKYHFVGIWPSWVDRISE